MKRILIYAVAALLVGCAPPLLKPRPHQQVATIDYSSGIDAQLESLARQVAIQLGRKRCGRVGVQGFFDVNGRSRRFEKYVETEFVNRLLRISRLHIHANKNLILEITPESASSESQSNEAVDFKSCLLGATVEFPQGVKISVQIMEAKTGFVYGTASVMVQRDKMVDSLLSNFGEKRFSAYGNTDFRVGEVIKTGENQYIDLIPHEYTLYVKQINFQYALFSDSFSNVEIFLNEDFRVMNVNDMISMTYNNERYILALRDVSNGMAVFTFAHLNEGRFKSTENFSWRDKAPYLSDGGSNIPAEADSGSSASEAEKKSENNSSSTDADGQQEPEKKSETEETSEETNESTD